MRTTYRLNLAFILICCAMSLLQLLSGCGGGTVGTGGTGSSEFSGRIFQADGAPVAGARVTIQETGDSATTSSSGDFDFESAIDTPAVTLLVEASNIQAKTVIDAIPAGPQTINLALQVNAADKTVEVKEKHIAPRPITPIPAPASPAPNQPTVVPTEISALPSSTPQSSATAAPTATPEPEATATATPNPLPTVEATPTLAATPQPRTIFVGTVVSNDPTLLEGALINIAGRDQHPIGPDGSFRFTVPAMFNDRPIVVHSLDQSPRVSVDGITLATHKVKLGLRLEQKPSGRIKLTLESSQVADPIDPDLTPQNAAQTGSDSR